MVAGFLLALIFFLFRRFRDVAVALLALVILFVILMPGTGAVIAPVSTFIAFVIGFIMAKAFLPIACFASDDVRLGRMDGF